jgi:hypothetical protein
VSTVAVPRWLLASLAVVLGVSLLAVAYLMGRQSLRAEPAVTAVPARHAPAPRPPTATEVTAPTAVPAPAVGEAHSSGETPDHQVERGPVPDLRPIAEPHAAAAPQVDAAAAGRVAVYFAGLDRVSGTGFSGLSQEGAQRLIAAAVGGDTSGLDGLVADAERAEREVQATLAPPECVEYHHELLGLLSESRALLEELRTAMAAQNSDGLVLMSARAGALQRRAEELRDREKNLRARYNVPPG